MNKTSTNFCMIQEYGSETKKNELMKCSQKNWNKLPKFNQNYFNYCKIIEESCE